MNTDETQPVTAYSTVAPTFRVEGDQFQLVFWYAPKDASPPPSSLTVERRERVSDSPDDASARRLRHLPGGSRP